MANDHTPPQNPSIVSLTVQPTQLQAAFNPVLVTLHDEWPTTGTSYFVRVYVINTRDVVPTPSKTGRLVATLIRPAIGHEAAFDLAGVLQGELDPPQPVAAAGRDAAAYVGYYYQYGTVTYDVAGVQVLTLVSESAVCWALRAALPLSGTGDLTNSFGRAYDEATPETAGALPLTNRPTVAEIDRASNVLLPVFFCREGTQGLTQKLYVSATLTYADGSTEDVTGAKISANAGGVYLLDASPATLVFDTVFRNALLRIDAQVYASFEALGEGYPLTVARTFLMRTAPLRQPLEVRFVNRRGGWDALSFTRSREGQLKTKPVLYNSLRGERVLRFDADSEETLFTPWLPASHEPWLRDLLLSPYVTVDGAYVKLKAHTLNRNNDDDLVSLTLTYQPEYDENVLTM
ncbi:hypothetical protein Q5H93_06225 [Hymenobacter sp. ASUV-10]|uniref:Virion structural protein n=1 Tax=Hymenobacter aranciens TaxID=3063996 RepID=A0ABT9B822_9BACT|nr:hypothetical protein [Hymenobacter sp. ASUV-10]MDO7874322.1 hypothetical protein [Hymenobacter sp. ASUV-10]